jgi:ATP-dependent DNA ligase
MAYRKSYSFSAVPVLRHNFRELPDVPAQWVKSSMVVEVEYRQRMEDGLRHAALKGLRPDKKPRVIRRSLQFDRGPF